MLNTSKLAPKRLAQAGALTFALALLGGPASASHSWNGYHWAWNDWPSNTPIPLMLGNNVGSTWTPFLNTASNDWNSPISPFYPAFATSVVNGGINPKTCKAKNGMVQVCAAKYGYNGWLGVAQIWLTGDHITKGTVKLNDSYYSLATYNQPSWRHMVVCQEVGHTLGLDHQDTDFSNDNLGTCMDYTNDPTGYTQGGKSNEHPDGHDYEELDIVYDHNDGFSTVATQPVASSPHGNGHSHSGVQLAALNIPADDWGRAVRFTSGGKGRVFVKELSKTERVITFVTWIKP